MGICSDCHADRRIILGEDNRHRCIDCYARYLDTKRMAVRGLACKIEGEKNNEKNREIPSQVEAPRADPEKGASGDLASKGHCHESAAERYRQRRDEDKELGEKIEEVMELGKLMLTKKQRAAIKRGMQKLVKNKMAEALLKFGEAESSGLNNIPRAEPFGGGKNKQGARD